MASRHHSKHRHRDRDRDRDRHEVEDDLHEYQEEREKKHHKRHHRRHHDEEIIHKERSKATKDTYIKESKEENYSKADNSVSTNSYPIDTIPKHTIPKQTNVPDSGQNNSELLDKSYSDFNDYKVTFTHHSNDDISEPSYDHYSHNDSLENYDVETLKASNNDYTDGHKHEHTQQHDQEDITESSYNHHTDQDTLESSNDYHSNDYDLENINNHKADDVSDPSYDYSPDEDSLEPPENYYSDEHKQELTHEHENTDISEYPNHHHSNDNNIEHSHHNSEMDNHSNHDDYTSKEDHSKDYEHESSNSHSSDDDMLEPSYDHSSHNNTPEHCGNKNSNSNTHEEPNNNIELTGDKYPVKSNYDTAETNDLENHSNEFCDNNYTHTTCSTNVTSKTIPICESINQLPVVTPRPVIIKVPVVLAEPLMTISILSTVKLEDGALEIKRIRKNVYLTQCSLLPNSGNDNPDVGLLFISGFIRKNIEYTTKEYNSKGTVSGKIKHTTIKVPFDCTARINFVTRPIYTNTTPEEKYETLINNIKFRNSCEDSVIGRDICEQSFRITELFNEKVFCELVNVEIIETDILENPMKTDSKLSIDQTFHNVTEKVVLHITIKLLQNQQIEIR